jgi:arylsulfatase A-like enzyme
MKSRAFLLATLALLYTHAPASAQQLATSPPDAASPDRPHIVFVMADDMGWGQTGYRGHPRLKTPELDAMAAAGLRFERFYAGCPVCSPTRASVLTGRANDRTGVLSHGYALRPQEKTIAQALQQAGYVTGHFGKWHLSGFRGPGAPILLTDPRSPGAFGFDEWLSVTNFFDRDPILSRQGQFEEHIGDSSEIVVAEALKFLANHKDGSKPIFTIIWFGTPHSPFRALPDDAAQFADLNANSANHYGELVAMDRSIGTLRRGLRELKLADNTLLVFCSDNGGLPGINPSTVGGLRGNKGTVYEGGLRVPGIIEWPAIIRTPRVTHYPASTMDLFPTVVDLLDLPDDSLVQPVDGISLVPLLHAKSDTAEKETPELAQRAKPIPFRFGRQAAIVDNRHKLVTTNLDQANFALYDLVDDPAEARDLTADQPELAARLKKELLAWNDSVSASFAGRDYPAGRVEPPDPTPISWTEHPDYQPYLAEWQKRPEYRPAAANVKKAGPKKAGGKKTGEKKAGAVQGAEK